MNNEEMTYFNQLLELYLKNKTKEADELYLMHINHFLKSLKEKEQEK